MKYSEANRWGEINGTVDLTFTSCTTVSLPFCDNDAEVTEAHENWNAP